MRRWLNHLMALMRPAEAEADPDAADRLAVHVNSAAALIQSGALDEAIEHSRRALEIDPHCVHAWTNLSIAQLAREQVDEALRSAERAARLAPDFLPARTQLGDALIAANRPREAAQNYAEAIRLHADSAVAHNSLGFSLLAAGELERASGCFDRALALDPHYVQAHVNRASTLLLAGRYGAGWDEYEWRLRDPANARAGERWPGAPWGGSPLDGRSILVYGEQGIGDQIMHASCLPDLLAQASRCALVCDRRLAPIFRRSFPGMAVHADPQEHSSASTISAALGTVDLKAASASLPRFLRRNAGDFRRDAYLKADPERVAHWRERLERLGPGRKIGLSWRGGVQATRRRARSIALHDLLPRLQRTGVTFISLQYGDSASERAALERAAPGALHHWREALEDYAETAALVCALDATLSVCTALVHLCGALGRPVWVMAPYVPEARYGLKGRSMPWYASATMLRQPTPDDWESVLKEATVQLEGLH